jgi:hypothetical protein
MGRRGQPAAGTRVSPNLIRSNLMQAQVCTYLEYLGFYQRMNGKTRWHLQNRADRVHFDKITTPPVVASGCITIDHALRPPPAAGSHQQPRVSSSCAGASQSTTQPTTRPPFCTTGSSTAASPGVTISGVTCDAWLDPTLNSSALHVLGGGDLSPHTSCPCPFLCCSCFHTRRPPPPDEPGGPLRPAPGVSPGGHGS